MRCWRRSTPSPTTTSRRSRPRFSPVRRCWRWWDPTTTPTPSLLLFLNSGSSMIKVGVLGARGRMGRTVCQTIEDADGTELAAQVDQGDDRDALLSCDVVVDFTHVAAVMDNLRWSVGHGLNVVVGTSGF